MFDPIDDAFHPAPRFEAVPTHFEQCLLVVSNESVFAQLPPVSVLFQAALSGFDGVLDVSLPRGHCRVNLKRVRNRDRISGRTRYLLRETEVLAPRLFSP